MTPSFKKKYHRETDHTGETNQHGVFCVSKAEGVYECVCQCGQKFFCKNFIQVIGCKRCRTLHARKRVQDFREIEKIIKRREVPEEQNQCSLSILNPKKMWERICKRHRDWETDISTIALQRLDY